VFDWELFACLVIACIPGILITVSGALKAMEGRIQASLPEGKEPPPRAVLILASSIQSLILMAVAAAVGTLLAPRVGLGAPFFEALVSGEPLWPALKPMLVPSLTVGVAGALLFVAAYYWFFRPRLDRETVQAMEGLRNELGIWGRVLYGGIAEEVLTRWGLMTLFVWLGSLLVPGSSAGQGVAPTIVWVAIVVSGILFGLGHAPSYLAAGCHKTPIFFATMLCLNLWASLIFGWLYWQYGLLAAMMGHMLFHLVWWPFDRRIYKHRAAEA
jgi:hypothetical protein